LNLFPCNFVHPHIQFYFLADGFGQISYDDRTGKYLSLNLQREEVIGMQMCGLPAYHALDFFYYIWKA